MKAGPALSIECTRNEYHHKVPLRSSPLSFLRRPNQIIGSVVMTGTNMMTKCKNRKPVARGSHTYVSITEWKVFHTLLKPYTLSGTFFCTSALDASSMCSSGVFPSPFSSSESSTNAAGVSRPSTRFLGFGNRPGGGWDRSHFGIARNGRL